MTAISNDRQRQQASVTSSTVAGGVFGASLAAVPTSFERPPVLRKGIQSLLASRQFKVGIVGAVTGAALAAATAGVANLTDSSGLAAGSAIAGVGLIAAQLGRLKPGGFFLRDSGGILRSAGKLGVAGGVSVAGTSALRDTDTPGVNSKGGAGVITGAASGAAFLGVLGAMGALKRAPLAEEIARHTLMPNKEWLAEITPEMAKAQMSGRDALARRLFMELPAPNETMSRAERWDAVGKGKGFLRGTATEEDIRETMGFSLKQPMRVYTSVAEAADPQERIKLTLDRIESALDKGKYGMVHVVSADAAGGTSEMLPLAVEHGRKGDVLTVMMQTTSTTPEKAFFHTDEMTDHYTSLMTGLKDRIAGMRGPEGETPEVITSGLCLGTVPIYKAYGRAGRDLDALGIDHAILPVGPAMERDVRRTIGDIDRGKVAGAVHKRSREEVLQASDRGDATPRILTRTEHDDPLRIGLHSLLVKFPMREKQYFMPVVSAVAHYLDAGLEKPVDGVMREVGHRVEATAIADANFGAGLGMSRRQMDAVDQMGIRINAMRGISKQGARANG